MNERTPSGSQVDTILKNKPKGPWSQFLIKIAVLSLVVLLFVGIYQLFVPKVMSVSEYKSRLKSQFNMRGFVIRGKVIRVRKSGSFVRMQGGNGNEMGYIVVRQDGVKAYVWFDPKKFSAKPNKRDIVRVVGEFESVPFYRHGKMPKRNTTGIASSIEILESAPSYEEEI